MSRINLSALVIVGMVLPAVVNCDLVLDTLEKSYNNYNILLSTDQKESLANFKAQVELEGVVLTVDKAPVVPKDAYEKSVSKVLVEKHGKYSPDTKDPKVFAQFSQDYNTFIRGPCDAAKRDIITAETAFYIGAVFNHKYIETVKSRPFLNDFLEKARLCAELFAEGNYLVKSSYDYMVSHQ